jgi:hypothetical protein
MLFPHTRATSVRLEVWGATRKSGLLEKIVRRSIELVAPDGSVHEDSGGETPDRR